METAGNQQAKIELEQIGHTGTTVKDGIVSSLKGHQ